AERHDFVCGPLRAALAREPRARERLRGAYEVERRDAVIDEKADALACAHGRYDATRGLSERTFFRPFRTRRSAPRAGSLGVAANSLGRASVRREPRRDDRELADRRDVRFEQVPGPRRAVRG